VILARPVLESESRFFTKKEKGAKRKKRFRKGKPVETAAVEEIDRRWPSATSIDDFHSCLKKPTPRTLRLFHSHHRLDDD
jgi:hypothetical protein